MALPCSSWVFSSSSSSSKRNRLRLQGRRRYAKVVEANRLARRVVNAARHVGTYWVLEQPVSSLVNQTWRVRDSSSSWPIWCHITDSCLHQIFLACIIVENCHLRVHVTCICGDRFSSNSHDSHHILLQVTAIAQEAGDAVDPH